MVGKNSGPDGKVFRETCQHPAGNLAEFRDDHHLVHFVRLAARLNRCRCFNVSGVPFFGAGSGDHSATGQAPLMTRGCPDSGTATLVASDPQVGAHHAQQFSKLTWQEMARDGWGSGRVLST